MKHPCLECDHHLSGGDKSADCCLRCNARVAYDRQSRGQWEAPTVAGMRGNIGAPPQAAPRTQIRPEMGRKEDGPVERKIVETKTKVCSREDCVHAGWEQSLDNFDRRTRAPDGKASYCKDCRRRIQREAERRKGRKPRQLASAAGAADVQDGMKRCVKCKEPKVLADFPINKLVKGGYENTCKQCRKDASRERRGLPKTQQKRLPAPIAPAPEASGPAAAHRGIYLAAAVRIGVAAPATDGCDGAADERAAELLRILYPRGIAPETYADLSRVVRILDHLLCIAATAAEPKEAPAC